MKKLLTALLILGALAVPKTSRALEGIIVDSDTNEGFPNAIVKFYDGHWLMDSVRTDENGHYNVNPVSVKLPKENINLPSIEKVYLTDISGRKITTLNQNELSVQLPSRLNLPSGTYFLTTNNAAIQFTTIEQGNITFNPLLSLEEKTRALQEYHKNMSTTAGADEVYTLSVSDDGVQGQIGDYYDASINADESLESLNVELIHFYDMEDWDGDFLEYLRTNVCGIPIQDDEGKGPRRNVIWGDYPQYYPVPVNLDSAGCYYRNTEEGARLRLELVIDAFNRWEEKTDLDLVEFYGRSGWLGDGQWRYDEISIDWSGEGAMYLAVEYGLVSPGDLNATRISMALISIGYNYSEEEIRAWSPTIQCLAGGAIGWYNFSSNPYSIRHIENGGLATNVTNDDGHVLRTLTLLKDFTNLGNYLQE